MNNCWWYWRHCWLSKVRVKLVSLGCLHLYHLLLHLELLKLEHHLRSHLLSRHSSRMSHHWHSWCIHWNLLRLHVPRHWNLTHLWIPRVCVTHLANCRLLKRITSLLYCWFSLLSKYFRKRIRLWNSSCWLWCYFSSWRLSRHLKRLRGCWRLKCSPILLRLLMLFWKRKSCPTSILILLLRLSLLRCWIYWQIIKLKQIKTWTSSLLLDWQFFIRSSRRFNKLSWIKFWRSPRSRDWLVPFELKFFLLHYFLLGRIMLMLFFVKMRLLFMPHYLLLWFFWAFFSTIFFIILAFTCTSFFFICKPFLNVFCFQKFFHSLFLFWVWDWIKSLRVCCHPVSFCFFIAPLFQIFYIFFFKHSHADSLSSKANVSMNASARRADEGSLRGDVIDSFFTTVETSFILWNFS